MRAAQFTDEIGGVIVEKMQGLKQDGSVSADVAWSNREDAWEAMNTGCYAFIIDRMNDCPHHGDRKAHPDHFGIVYKTFAGFERNPTKIDATCHSWLEALLNPDGIFSGVLPFLWHKTPKEVLDDRGFTLHGLMDPACNPGLVWTFLLASRMLWEHSNERPLWDQCRKEVKDPDIALFLTLALQRNGDYGYVMGVKGHGQPITNQWQKARSFLRRDFRRHSGQGPFGSSQFLKIEHTNVFAPPRSLTLPQWAEEMEKVRAEAA